MNTTCIFILSIRRTYSRPYLETVFILSTLGYCRNGGSTLLDSLEQDKHPLEIKRACCNIWLCHGLQWFGQCFINPSIHPDVLPHRTLWLFSNLTSFAHYSPGEQMLVLYISWSVWHCRFLRRKIIFICRQWGVSSAMSINCGVLALDYIRLYCKVFLFCPSYFYMWKRKNDVI